MHVFSDVLVHIHDGLPAGKEHKHGTCRQEEVRVPGA
jgi:hypothetical protein